MPSSRVSAALKKFFCPLYFKAQHNGPPETSRSYFRNGFFERALKTTPTSNPLNMSGCTCFIFVFKSGGFTTGDDVYGAFSSLRVVFPWNLLLKSGLEWASQFGRLLWSSTHLRCRKHKRIQTRISFRDQ